MQHIQLSDDSYVINTSEGMKMMNLKSFNFHKIKSLLAKGVGEDKVLPLLETPTLPNGLFELYLCEDSDTLYVKNITEGNPPSWSTINHKEGSLLITNEENVKFMGVYASEKEIMADWPEYVI